jgi:hypothetical protein
MTWICPHCYSLLCEGYRHEYAFNFTGQEDDAARDWYADTPQLDEIEQIIQENKEYWWPWL